ncbi:MAG: HNH endonuclease signature motif containing protein [Nanoarchaeota archaeon]|nr:HNH endonuclease signature motif containing protein [Nanoarchaeota archaeon]
MRKTKTKKAITKPKKISQGSRSKVDYKKIRDPFRICDKAKKVIEFLQESHPIDMKEAIFAKINTKISCNSGLVEDTGDLKIREKLLKEKDRFTKEKKYYSTFYEVLFTHLSSCYVSLKIQRLFGSWDDPKKEDYLRNLIFGFDENVSTLHMINCDSSLAYALQRNDEIGRDSANEYKKITSSECSWMNIDGQHRVVTIMNYILGEGKGNKLGVGIENKKWRELSLSEQNALLYSVFIVQDYNAAIYRDLPKIFIRTNSNSPLSAPQKRHAYRNIRGVDVSPELFDVSCRIEEKLQEYAYGFFTEAEVHEALDMEYFLKIFVMKNDIKNSKIANLKEERLNEMCLCENNFTRKDIEEFEKFLEKEICTFMGVANKFADFREYFIPRGKVDRKKFFQLLFFKEIFVRFISEHMKILDSEKFLKEFLFDFIYDKLKSVNVFEVPTRSGGTIRKVWGMHDEFAFEKCSDRKKEDDFFFNLMENDTSNGFKFNSKARMFLNVIQDNDVLSDKRFNKSSFAVLDSRRLFTSEEKEEMWEVQSHRCKHCGDLIDYRNPLSCHAHHVEEYSRGGRTEVCNGILLCVGCHEKETKRYMIERKSKTKEKSKKENFVSIPVITQSVKGESRRQEGGFVNE